MTPKPLLRAASLAAVLLGSACTNLSLPGVGTDPGNAPPAPVTAAPPATDSRGVISYPTYDAVRAQRGDTPASIATRLGIDPAALARHNGLPENAALRDGELLVLPTRITSGAGASGGDDIASIAGAALDRADGAASGTPGSDAAEPVRHTVTRGETAYSIARLYNVSVRALADWNGLPPDYAVREGQVLLIPLPGQSPAGTAAAGTAAAAASIPDASQPGEGTRVAEPPSAAEPQPRDDTPAPAPAEEVAVAPIEAPQTQASDTARLAKPVEGRILRGYEKGANEGVDFSAAVGAPVRAAEGGTVAAITRDVDQVPIVVIRHPDNLLTVYANVDSVAVAKGDTVGRGQQIGVVRQSDPGFLHFEVRNGFESVDPVDYLN
ncbi:LysM peptidoglycan-binding domain-containing protein [Mangrovicoccus algicola]|uniref:Peptidoglycan DD-metalloendopeptidase family protein n=1 Tax=Mangrovicoccus algicola TaxID=2771008 RepID=A0A8J6YZB7_9RHOB|nr:LysM peptidoglycan-binding domain-containing protein [Mangrovicoccus algicola]MBE3639454.1 peptidoglycan DD-metalloendopeptidase family protein [Mangrovicoccus algicola]